MNRFFIENKNIHKDTFKILDEKVFHKARKVLRLKNNDTIELFDETGTNYTATITLISNKIIEGNIISINESDTNKNYNTITMAIALPKAGKLDDILKSCTEIGVKDFLIFESNSCITKFKSIDENKKS